MSEKKQNPIKNNLTIFIIAIILISGWFCWFQLRPFLIRKKCAKTADENLKKFAGELGLVGKTQMEKAENLYDFHDENYNLCLKRNGIK